MDNQEITFMSLANILTLSAMVIHEISGNEIANTVNGNPLTDESIHQMCSAELQAQLKNRGF